MPELVAIVPSRGRPHAAAELAASFEATCTAGTQLVFAVDNDDPALDEYRATGGLLIQPSRDMVEALNQAAGAYASLRFAVAFMGDDHRPRTKGWDRAYLDALHELGTGLVYGNDLLQGENLPTQVAMTSDIVRALGYMAPPELTHLWVDNFWLSLGRSADCIRYLPDVIVEHVHPVAGKAEWDAGYLRVNSGGMNLRDREAFADYVESGRFEADVEKIKALRGA